MHQQVTRNDSDEAERRERSPSGVVSAANDEELAAAGGQVSGKAAPASGSASQPDRPPPPAGVRGTCATSPGAIRRPEARCLLPSGYQCLFLHSRKAVPPGSVVCSCCNAKPNIKLTCDWKAEMNLRTPKTRSGLTGTGTRTSTEGHGSTTGAERHYRHGACPEAGAD